MAIETAARARCTSLNCVEDPASPVTDTTEVDHTSTVTTVYEATPIRTQRDLATSPTTATSATPRETPMRALARSVSSPASKPIRPPHVMTAQSPISAASLTCEIMGQW